MFKQSLILALGLIMSALSAKASPWYEYKTHTSIHSRVSFTTSSIAPNIGLPYGATTVGILYVELFNIASSCPTVTITSANRTYSLTTQFDQDTQKCWGRLDDKTIGTLYNSAGQNIGSIQHFNYPLFIYSGTTKEIFKLHVETPHGDLVEYFMLADSLK